MSIADPSGLLLLLAIPIVAAITWSRRRARARRVAGLFLWADACRSSARPIANESARVVALVRDAGAIALLAGIVCLSFGAAASDRGGWSDAAWRLGACVAIAWLLLANWRSTNAREQAEPPEP